MFDLAPFCISGKEARVSISEVFLSLATAHQRVEKS